MFVYADKCCYNIVNMEFITTLYDFIFIISTINWKNQYMYVTLL